MALVQYAQKSINNAERVEIILNRSRKNTKTLIDRVLGIRCKYIPLDGFTICDTNTYTIFLAVYYYIVIKLLNRFSIFQPIISKY